VVKKNQKGVQLSGTRNTRYVTLMLSYMAPDRLCQEVIRES